MLLRPLSAVCILVASLFSINAVAQDSLAYRWSRTIGGTGNEVQAIACAGAQLGQNNYTPADITLINQPDIAVTPDGGMIVASTTFSKDGDIRQLRNYADTATGGADIFITKLRADGSIVWKKCFGGSGFDAANSVIVESNGYIVAGSTGSSDGIFNNVAGIPMPFVMKIDLNGNLVWAEVYMQGYVGAMSNSYMQKIARLPTGGYVFMLNRSLTSPIDYWQMEMFVISSSGSMMGRTVFTGNTALFGTAMSIAPDGAVFLVGNTTASTGDFVVYPPMGCAGFITRLKLEANNTFTKVWYKLLWPSNNPWGNNRAFDMAMSADGKIYVSLTFLTYSGNPIAGATLQRLDTAGNRLWNTAYETYSHREFFSVDTAGNNGVLMGAFTTGVCSGSGQHVVVTRVDSAGALYWQKCYTGAGTTPGNNYVMRVKYISDLEHYVAALTNADSLGIHTYNQPNYTTNTCPTDLWLFKGGPANIINGKVFFDINKNGVLNTGEPLIPGVIVRSVKSTANKAAYSNSGNFFLGIDTGVYTTSALLPPGRPFTVAPASDVYGFYSFGTTRTLNFAVQALGTVTDAEVELSPLSAPRVNRSLLYELTYRNKGNVNISNTTAWMAFDHRLTFISANPAPSQIIGDTLKWTDASLSVLTTKGVIISFTSPLSPALNLGDTVKCAAGIQFSVTDANPADNFQKVNQVVVGPYDPNDKHEIHEGSMTLADYSAGRYLKYLVNFQNLGTDTAFYVEVRDTLDTKIDPATFELIASSHDCSVSVNDSKRLTFRFYNIKLATLSQNEELSKGYISFRVKPIAGLVAGDTIRNTASIYFDYNTPVVTNQAKTGIVSTILPLQILQFTVQPRNDQHLLRWTTANEMNIQRFTVERSEDGVRFYVLGQVSARGGDASYSFTDTKPLAGRNFYRLKVNESDGHFSYSDIRILTRESALTITIHPNPVVGFMKANITSPANQQIEYRLVSSIGKIMVEGSQMLQKGTSQLLIDLHQFPAGTYALVITDEAGETNSRVVLKR